MLNWLCAVGLNEAPALPCQGFLLSTTPFPDVIACCVCSWCRLRIDSTRGLVQSMFLPCSCRIRFEYPLLHVLRLACIETEKGVHGFLSI